MGIHPKTQEMYSERQVKRYTDRQDRRNGKVRKEDEGERERERKALLITSKGSCVRCYLPYFSVPRGQKAGTQDFLLPISY